jgi:hypothetical protein
VTKEAGRGRESMGERQGVGDRKPWEKRGREKYRL